MPRAYAFVLQHVDIEMCKSFRSYITSLDSSQKATGGALAVALDLGRRRLQFNLLSGPVARLILATSAFVM